MPVGFILSGFDFKAYMIAALPMALTFGGINYVSTVLVPNKQRVIQMTRQLSQAKPPNPTTMSPAGTQSVDSMGSTLDTSNDSVEKQTLEKLLTNKKAIHKFMIHLSKELSSIDVLCLLLLVYACKSLFMSRSHCYVDRMSLVVNSHADTVVHHSGLSMALKLLQKAEFGDLLLNLAARSLQLKIYYELQELDLLDSHLQAFRTFLRRKKELGYHRDNYLNTVRFTLGRTRDRD